MFRSMFFGENSLILFGLAKKRNFYLNSTLTD